jgi:hypothetical protein
MPFSLICFGSKNLLAILIFSSSVYPGIIITYILSNNGGSIFKVFAVVTNNTSDKS